MKFPIVPSLGLAISAGVSLVTPAFAVVNIDYVSVGNAGNAADTQVMADATRGYGSVAYDYKIGKTEVTNAQYAALAQWAVDNGHATATSGSLRDALDGSTQELLDLDGSGYRKQA